MTAFHAVVWMDHTQAHVLMFDREHVEAQRVKARSQHTPKHGHVGADKAFFEEIAQALQGVSEVLVAGKGDRLGHYIDADNYTQHNPAVGDGVPSLVAALQAMAQAGTPMTYTQLHTVLGEGNFVLAVSEGQMLGKLVAFYDLFRVANGKIVEHWDTIESIPVPADWKNQNGKFGF